MHIDLPTTLTLLALPHAALSLKVIFGSCNKVQLPNPFWGFINDRQPDVFVWGGDNIYADRRTNEWFLDERNMPKPRFVGGEPHYIRELYDLQKRVPGYDKLVANEDVTIVGTWDDHDFGTNDGDRSFEHKEESQKAFWDFLDEPQDSPNRARDGVYSNQFFSLCDKNHGKRVAPGDESCDELLGMHLLDNRMFKDPWHFLQEHEPTILGEEQWAWLEDSLCSSKAVINIIVAGLQMLPERPLGENWHKFSDERERLLELVNKCEVKGVLLVSGDVHFAEYNKAVCTSKSGETEDSVPVREITSSGLTHSWGTRLPGSASFSLNTYLKSLMIVAQHLLPFRFQNPDVGRFTEDGTFVQKAYYLYRNFGELVIEKNDSGEWMIKSKVIDDQNQTVMQEDWVASDGDMGRFTAGDINCEPIQGRASKAYTMFAYYSLLMLALSPMGMVLGLITGVLSLAYKRICRKPKLKQT